MRPTQRERLRLALFSAAALVSFATATAASAADKVAVGVLRFVSSGGLYLAYDRGYFKAEGLDVELTYFQAAQPIAVAIASGDIQLGVTAITAGTLNLAAKGALKIVAAQGSERKGFKGNAIVVANAAYERGITSAAKLAGSSFAITQVGSSFHYQLGQIAAARGFDLASISMKPLQGVPNMVAAVKTGQVDGAIIPPHIAGPMAERGEARIIGYVSDHAAYQFGALFAASRLVEQNRDLVSRFVKAYARGMGDYADAFLRLDAKGERIADAKASEAGAIVGRYVYPSDPPDVAAKKVIEAAVYADRDARLDVADLERQIAWYKSQKLVGEDVDGKAFIDASFVK